MNINVDKLGAFKAVNLGNGNAIVNMDGNQAIRQNGTFKSYNIFRSFRSAATQAENNTARAQFLKSLAAATGLSQYVHEDNGHITFETHLVDLLEHQLGHDIFKGGDYTLNRDGEITSGKPLTQRRINAVSSKLSALKAQELIDDVSNVVGRMLGQTRIEKFGKVHSIVSDKICREARACRTDEEKIIFARDFRQRVETLLVAGEKVRRHIENELDRLVENDDRVYKMVYVENKVVDALRDIWLQHLDVENFEAVSRDISNRILPQVLTKMNNVATLYASTTSRVCKYAQEKYGITFSDKAILETRIAMDTAMREAPKAEKYAARLKALLDNAYARAGGDANRTEDIYIKAIVAGAYDVTAISVAEDLADAIESKHIEIPTGKTNQDYRNLLVELGRVVQPKVAPYMTAETGGDETAMFMDALHFILRMRQSPILAYVDSLPLSVITDVSMDISNEASGYEMEAVSNMKSKDATTAAAVIQGSLIGNSFRNREV